MPSEEYGALFSLAASKLYTSLQCDGYGWAFEALGRKPYKGSTPKFHGCRCHGVSERGGLGFGMFRVQG